MKSILDPTFRYTPSNETDIRKTFNRIRREIARAAPKTASTASRVVPFGRVKSIAIAR